MDASLEKFAPFYELMGMLRKALLEVDRPLTEAERRILVEQLDHYEQLVTKGRRWIETIP